MLLKTKIFNGEKYTKYGNPWINKSPANRIADNLRTRGFKARVVKSGKIWIVYKGKARK